MGDLLGAQRLQIRNGSSAWTISPRYVFQEIVSTIILGPYTGNIIEEDALCS
jgi:hypothetical protein